MVACIVRLTSCSVTVALLLSVGVWWCCSGWVRFEEDEENVQLRCQRGITLSSSPGLPVVGEVLDSLSHLPAVLTLLSPSSVV